MSKTLWYLFHPYADNASVNLKLLKMAKHRLPEVKFVDLSRGQNYCVKEQQKNMEEADTIVFQYPVFWFSKPFDLSEFIAKTWIPGWCYLGGEALKGKKLITVSSTASSFDIYNNRDILPYGINENKNEWDSAAVFVGAKSLKHLNLYSAKEASDEQLEAHIDSIIAAINE